MNCEGLVTKVDSFYGYFEVNDKHRVYLCLLKTNNDEIKLPELDSMSVSKKLHKSLNTFVACQSSIITGKFKDIIKPHSFTNLIKKYKLGAADILMIDQALRMFETNFLFENEMTGKDIFSSLVETIIKLHLSQAEVQKHFCLNKYLTGVNISSINSCKYVEISSSKFNDFPQWSFGVHTKPKNGSYLFGYVYVDPQYGFLMLKDNFHKIVCIIQDNNEDLRAEHCYVLIKNYKIITEIYKEKKIPNLEYLITHSKDVIIIRNDKECLELFGHILPKNFKYSMEFIIMRKSTLCVGHSKKPETYLQIKIVKKNDDKIEDTHFLTLPSQYIIIVLHLKEGFKYRLHHNEPLKEEVNTELSSIEKLKNFTLNEKDAYFEEVAENVIYTPVLKVEDCREYLSKNSNMFSFEGVIESRGFVKNLSQKLVRTSLYGFSTPGKDTHTLKFGYQENDNDLNITVYLNDWINRLMPLGLIPQMRVKLKHVQPKSTYIKSTVFTSIEIISYDQTVDFYTANLFENHEIVWGPPYFLSKGNYIPQGVVVWSKVYNIHILEVKMSNTCKECNVIVDGSGACCIQCGCKKTLFKFFLVMHVNDVFGISRIIVKDVKFLRLVLNLTEAQFPVWLEVFQSIGEFSFNIHEKGVQFDQVSLKYLLP